MSCVLIMKTGAMSRTKNPEGNMVELIVWLFFFFSKLLVCFVAVVRGSGDNYLFVLYFICVFVFVGDDPEFVYRSYFCLFLVFFMFVCMCVFCYLVVCFSCHELCLPLSGFFELF